MERLYTKRQGLNILSEQLKQERRSHEARLRAVADVTHPDSPLWITSDTNRGERKDRQILDSTATMASETAAAGMMAGISSPARPWFQLTLDRADLADVYVVKGWLDEVTDRMRKVFLKSNLYQSLPSVYQDLVDFGTAAMWVEEDEDDVIHTTPFALGEYWIGADRKGRIRTFYREYRMTVRNLVDEFGRDKVTGEIDWSKFSQHVKDQYSENKMEQWIDVCHMVYPNEDYRPKSALSKHKRYASCYYEMGRSSASGSPESYDVENQNIFLRESGYNLFPVLCPRWKVKSGSAYGISCPGFTALGDNNQLQHGEMRKMQAVDQTIFPPLVGPESMKRVKIGALGETTYSDAGANNTQGWRAAYQINPDFKALDDMQDRLRARIKRVYLEDLFLMMTDSDRRQITAEEIRVRQQEKLLRVGPVLEQLNQAFFDQLIEITFDAMVRHLDENGQSLIPQAPEELMGTGLTVQYVSIMAQAQKAIGLSAYQELSAFATGLAAVYPQIFDTLNVDKMVDKVATALGVSPEVLNPPEAVAQMRQARAQAQARQQAAEQAEMASGAVKNLATSPTDGESAYTDLVEQAKAGRLVAA